MSAACVITFIVTKVGGVMHHDDSDFFLLDLPSDPELHLEVVRAVALLAPLAESGFGPRSSDVLLWLECLQSACGVPPIH